MWLLRNTGGCLGVPTWKDHREEHVGSCQSGHSCRSSDNNVLISVFVVIARVR